MPYFNLGDPANGSVPATFSDTVDVVPSRGVRFSAAGAVRMKFVDGSIDTWNVLQGEAQPARVVRVFVSGTDVGMVGKVHLLY